MNPRPKIIAGAGLSVDSQRPASVVRGAAQPIARLHAVPVKPIGKPTSRLAEAVYVCFEFTVALIGLICSIPLLLIAMLMIRLDSPGPVLFFHKRPGRSVKMRGRDLKDRPDLEPPPGGYDPDSWYFVPSYFTMPKLRTMRHDARKVFPQYYAYEFPPGTFHDQFPTIKDDPRVTRAGRILRKLSIDELPNFWSVLIGDMRLIGPRPEAPEVLRYYTPEEMYKFACTPGIAGLAQVNGRGFLNWGQTLAWDLEYIRNRTVALDLKIMWATFKHLISRRGAF